MNTVLVIGLGLQGKAVVHDLEQGDLVSEIVVADMDLDAARGVSDGLGRVEQEIQEKLLQSPRLTLHPDGFLRKPGLPQLASAGFERRLRRTDGCPERLAQIQPDGRQQAASGQTQCVRDRRIEPLDFL